MSRWQVGLAALAIAVAGSGCTTIVRSSVASNGTAANAISTQFGPRSISDDGRYVVFDSEADNLVPNDTNHAIDVFRHDNLTGATIRVSVTGAGAQIPVESLDLAISGDGDHIAFRTAESMDPVDTNDGDDVYLRTVSTGQTEWVSIRPDGQPILTTSQHENLRNVSLSDNGQRVLMLQSLQGAGNLFLRDRGTHSTTLIGELAAVAFLSGDGNSFVETVLCNGGPCPHRTFEQPVDQLTPQVDIDTECGIDLLGTSINSRFVVANRFGVYPTFTCSGPTGLVRWDRMTQTFTAVPITTQFQTMTSISDDGRFVGVLDDNQVIRVADLTTGVMQVADPGPGPAFGAALSGNGRYIAFTTTSKLVADDANEIVDVYTRYAIQPGVSSIAPTSFPIGTTHATLTINGAELLPGVTVSVSGGGVSVNSVTLDSPTKATVDLTVSPTALGGARNVVVSNTGGFGHSDALCAGCLTVT